MNTWPSPGPQLADGEAGADPDDDLEQLLARLSPRDRAVLRRVVERISLIAAEEGEQAAEITLREIVEIVGEGRPGRTAGTRC